MMCKVWYACIGSYGAHTIVSMLPLCVRVPTVLDLPLVVVDLAGILRYNVQIITQIGPYVYVSANRNIPIS